MTSMASLRLTLLVTAGALAATIAAIAADPSPSPVDNPVGKWDDYEMIIQVDVPLRGTLRHVYVDRVSAAEARRTGKLPYGTRIVMRDFVGVADGQGGFKSDGHRLVPGKPTLVLVQQKEKGWGGTHPEAIRNGEWEYGLFTVDGAPIPVNTEVACMPCHKRYESTDYTLIVHNYFADLARR
jgi:cytochrome P460